MVKRLEHNIHSTCPIACTLDVVGDHWSLLIIRGLMFGDIHEYKDILKMPEGISSNILSDRLKKLEECDIIASAPHQMSKRRKLYYLTEKGKDFLPMMLEMAHWANKHLSDRIFIPEEKRAFIDNPPDEVAKMVLLRLKEWEEKNIT